MLIIMIKFSQGFTVSGNSQSVGMHDHNGQVHLGLFTTRNLGTQNKIIHIEYCESKYILH